MPRRKKEQKSGEWGGPRRATGPALAANRFAGELKEDKALTNEELSSAIATFSTLSAEQVDMLCPVKRDKVLLARVLTIAADRSALTQKVAQLREEFDELAPVIVKLLEKLV